MRKMSVVMSLIGLIVLFLIYSTSELDLIDASTIDESMIGKTVKSKVTVSSVKNFSDSVVIYPKKFGFKIYVEEVINVSGLIEFSGIVDEDKYGLIIRAQTIKEYN